MCCVHTPLVPLPPPLLALNPVFTKSTLGKEQSLGSSSQTTTLLPPRAVCSVTCYVFLSTYFCSLFSISHTGIPDINK